MKKFEAARIGELPQPFETLPEALDYIRGTPVDTVRPWIRNLHATGVNQFVIVAGSVLDSRVLWARPLLSPDEESMLIDWTAAASAVALQPAPDSRPFQQEKDA